MMKDGEETSYSPPPHLAKHAVPQICGRAKPSLLAKFARYNPNPLAHPHFLLFFILQQSATLRSGATVTNDRIEKCCYCWLKTIPNAQPS